MIDIIIVLFILFTPIIIVVIVIGQIKEKKEQKKRRNLLKQIDEIKNSYPRAFNAYIAKNKTNINIASSSKLESIIKYGLWSADENRLREIEEKEREIRQKYAEIAKEYPEGLKKWNKLNPISSIENIISNKDTIEKYEKQYKTALEYEQWEKEQAEFTQKCRDSIPNLLPSFGYYHYEIPFSKKDEDDESINGKYLVWQSFPMSYCLDDDLDYTDFEYIKKNTENIDEFKTNRIFQKSIFKQIINFITNLSSEYNISVYFSSNNKEWSVKELMRYFLRLLDLDELEDKIEFNLDTLLDSWGSSNIKIDYNRYPILKNRHIVIIEVQTDNSHLKEVCKNIIEQNKDKHPLITYISFLKGFDRAEMQELIAKKQKERADEEERKRKEQEEEERKKRELEKYKTCKNEIIKVLNDNEIKYLYHFTSVKNIDSIKQNGGLYSWWTLKQKNINVPFLGGEGIGQKLDLKYGLQDYVRLSFCNDHPMSYRHIQNGEQLVLLKIDIEVTTLKDTLFSDINATDNNHHHGGTLEDLLKINFNAVKRNFVKKEDSDFKPHQAEVMVKTFVPLIYIKNIDSPLYLL